MSWRGTIFRDEAAEVVVVQPMGPHVASDDAEPWLQLLHV